MQVLYALESQMLKTFLSGGAKILEDWKIKIAVLWLLWECGGIVQLMLYSFQPGVMERINAGELIWDQTTPELLLVFAIIFLIPLVMAFLSLTLKDSINRWANIIVGIVWLGLGFIDVPRLISNPAAYAILLWLTEVVAKVLIVWYAWKSK